MGASYQSARWRYIAAMRTDLYLVAAQARAEHGQLVGLSRDEPGSGTTKSGITTGIQHRF